MNLIFIIFYYAQWRSNNRPILDLTFRGDDYDIYYPDEKTTPTTVEISDEETNLLISNISNHIASDLTIDFSMQYQSEKISSQKRLSYLNPSETTRLIIPFKNVIEQFPDLFTTATVNNESFTLPKKSLDLQLIITVKYGPAPQYSIKNSYDVQWAGLDQTKEPTKQIVSWNIRDGLPIYKRLKE